MHAPLARRQRRIASLVALASAFAWSSSARAGNSDTFFLGNDAALQGGAVTARAQGGSAVWYNPAGLAATTYDSVDVGASAYLLRFGGNPDLRPVSPVASTSKKLSSLDLGAVPTALSLTRMIFGWNFGLGIFVPNRTVQFPRTSVVTQPSGGVPAELTIDGNDRFSEYYAGLSVGRALTSRLRLGVSVFGYYASTLDTRGQSSSSGADASSSAFSITHSTLDQQRLGIQLVWGLQYDAAKDWQVGFVFRSPVFQLYELSQEVDMSGSVDAASATPRQSSYQQTFGENLGIKSRRLRPMRAHVGVAHQIGPANLAIDGSLQPPFRDATIEKETDTVVNARVGLRAPLSDSVQVGAGFFTDLAPTRKLTRTGDTAIDYYGVSLAIDLATPYSVVDHEPKKPRSLIMSTTLAISYAFGSGRLANQGLDADANGLLRIVPVTESVAVHEFVFHIGSTLAK
jgi:hypothetical protein